MRSLRLAFASRSRRTSMRHGFVAPRATLRKFLLTDFPSRPHIATNSARCARSSAMSACVRRSCARPPSCTVSARPTLPIFLSSFVSIFDSVVIVSAQPP
jgi:hypothetical protein